MNNLIINGKQEFMGVEIPVIEGGFGEGQKVILAKTVAQIHEVELEHLNQLINSNLKRFGINDLINLIGENSDIVPKDFKIKTSNSQKFAYLLSQRGYTKLVAMMDNSNDKKWEVMNDLIDEYFTLKAKEKSGQAIQPQSNLDLLELQVKALKEVDGKVQEVRKDLEEFKGDLPLIGDEPEELQAVVRSVGTKALGGYGCPAYKDRSLSARVFKNVWKYIKDQFNVKRYKSIKRKNLSKAIELAYTYEAPFYLQEEIDLANNQVGFKEMK